MSHYIFKDKKVFALKDGRYMFLAKVADSSVTNRSGAHPAHWSIVTDLRMTSSVFLTKEEIYRQREEMLEKQRELKDDFYKEFGGEQDKPLLECDNYYGNTYRGSRKLKALYSFYGIRKTAPIETLYGRFGIYLEHYDRKTYKTIDSWRYDIDSYADIEALDKKYQELKAEGKPLCIGITGIYD